MDDLLADFVAETREMLEAIEGELVAWEAEPADRVRLDAIFRFVHTVKGNCGFFDFPQLEKLSHAAEGTLADIRADRRQPDRQLVSAILAIIDRIAEMTNAIETGDALSDSGDELLIAGLTLDAQDSFEPAPASTQNITARPSETPLAAPRSIRLPVILLDRLMSGVSDMVLARNDLSRRLSEAGNAPTLDGPFERLSAILADVREAVTRMRMQPIEQLYNAVPRLVRDLSAELGKQVVIDFEGANVELDREMIEMIRDPITHLIRNAVDHGIESPSQRLACGKREVGMLSIASRQSGNTIIMVIADDGAGLNEAKIGSKALDAGLVTKEELGAMSSASILNLIFEPGLSTADTVSSVSGRGVGMDVVRSNIEKLGGTIAVVSKAGKGTQFHLELPLTLSIISALTVSINGQFFAIPHSYIEEIAHGKSAAIEFSQVGHSDLVTFRGNRIPCLTLNTVLDVNPRQAGPDQRLVLLKLGSGKMFALAVDRIHDQEDLVIKPLSPAIMQCRTYAGTTLMDDGRPILMLDIAAIADRYGLVQDTGSHAPAAETSEESLIFAPSRTVMTFTCFDGRQRAINLDLVARIDQVAADAFDFEGGRANLVVDEEILDVAGITSADLPAGLIKVLRLTDSETNIAYPVAELGETITLSNALAPAEGDSTLEGIALIGGKPVPIIDGFAMFAGRHRRAETGVTPICALPKGDPWTERMLAPLIEQAGYRIASDDTASADVIITLAGQSGEANAASARTVITLHSDPDTAGETASDVYRYDKPGIVDALTRAKHRKAS